MLTSFDEERKNALATFKGMLQHHIFQNLWALAL
jgi:hypothetical protein